MEVAGALQAVADLMLQSVTTADGTGATYLALFPLNITHTDAAFTNFRGKGGFVVSAAWSATRLRVDGAVTVHSELGGLLDLQLPAGEEIARVNRTGSTAPVGFTKRAQPSRFAVPTELGGSYVITLK